MVSDQDKALSLIDNQIGPHRQADGYITQFEFGKLFQKGLFRNALIKIMNTFDLQVKCGQISDELSLQTKVLAYQRNSFLAGMDRTGDSFKDTKRTLESLQDIMLRDNPAQAEKIRLQFLENIGDPSVINKPKPISEEEHMRKQYRFIEPPTDAETVDSSEQ